MLVTIPDGLAKTYMEMSKIQGRSLDDVVTAQLTRFKDHTPGAGRCYVFSGPLLERVETALGKTITRSERDLCSRVEQLAAISFGHLRFDFSPGQLAEIDRMSTRRGMSPRLYVENIVRQMEGQFFNHVGGPAKPLPPKTPPAVVDLTPLGPSEGGGEGDGDAAA